jgi:hypothetical protein
MAKLCEDLEDYMAFADFVPVEPCPNPFCFGGHMPDPDESDPDTLWEEVPGRPGLLVRRVVAVICPVCAGDGVVFWVSPN